MCAKDSGYIHAPVVIDNKQEMTASASGSRSQSSFGDSRSVRVGVITGVRDPYRS